MSNPAPICTHIKTDGIRCGSPAVSGADFCQHHSAIKTATQAVPKGRAGSGEFAPIPFVFPEDRASMQINYFLLLQAFNQGQIDLKTFKSMMSMLKAMAANVGKTGSLVDDSDQRSGTRDQRGSKPTSQKRDVGHPQEEDEDDDPFADLRHLPEAELHAAMMERFGEIANGDRG